MSNDDSPMGEQGMPEVLIKNWNEVSGSHRDLHVLMGKGGRMALAMALVAVSTRVYVCVCVGHEEIISKREINRTTRRVNIGKGENCIKR